MVERFLKKEILNLLNFFPAVGIIGSRQVGKTTLSKMISKDIKKEVIYLDLESFADYNLLNESEIYFKENTDKCIIIDEIQRRPELFSLMRSIIDSNRENSKFIILGSSSPLILRKSSESLAGRISYVELSPFNFVEVKDVDSLNSLWFKGGYPLSFLNSEEYSRKFIDSLIVAYVEKEFSFLGLSASPVILRNLWNMLAYNNGCLINYSNLSKSLGISQKTISNYIDYFEGAFLVRRLRPYFTNIKKRLVKTSKIYIRDTGLLHNLLSINSQEELFRHPILGNSWEGFVIEQISQLLSNKYEIYFYRTQDGSETDLVITKSNFPVATVEIKFSNSPKISKGYSIALEDISSVNNFIIGYDVKEFRTKDNILVTNLENFLTEHIHNL